MEALFTSEKSTWETPEWMINHLAQFFSWDLDVCAHRPNVCETFFTKEDDSLEQSWQGLCWMNPPYGRGVEKWVDKALLESCRGAVVVCLLPVRTDTRWWNRTVPESSLAVFINKRLSFSGTKQKATFPSAFVVFGEISGAQRKALSGYGWPVRTVKVP